MTPLEDQIRDLYRQVTDAEQPPAKVSIAEALRQGRFLRRRRGFSATAAPVAVAAAVALIALALTLPAYVHRAAPVRPPTANPAPEPGQFDPLTVNISFGWLPPGEAAVTGGTGGLDSWLSVYQEHNLNLHGKADANTRWQLTQYARGACTLGASHGHLFCDTERQLSGHAPDINGHPAFWESNNGLGSPYGPHQALVWTYAPGYWAELTSTAGRWQSGQTLLRIARGAMIGAGATQPVKFVVQLTGVPSAWRIGSTFVVHTGGIWLAQNYTVTTRRKALWGGSSDLGNGLPSVVTYVGGGSCNLFTRPGHPKQLRINGYQVVANTNTSGGGEAKLCAPDANGLQVLESLSGAHARVSVTTLFQRMRVLGPKPSAWTTRPIAPLVVSSAVGFPSGAAIAVLALVVIVLAVTVALRRRAAS